MKYLIAIFDGCEGLGTVFKDSSTLYFKTKKEAKDYIKNFLDGNDSRYKIVQGK